MQDFTRDAAAVDLRQANPPHQAKTAPADGFEELLELARSGDQQAAAQIVTRYGKHVRRAVRRILPSRLRSLYDSEDFGQAVWKSFFTEREQIVHFSHPAALIAYLAGMARNKVVDESKRRINTRKHDLKRVQHVAWDSGLAPADPRTPSPSAVAMAEDVLARLIGGTAGVHRQILQLRLAGRSAKEIAEATGLHERAVRRAIAKLADLVED